VARRRRKTRRALAGVDYSGLQREARDRGFHVARWSPGDGLTRYRFFERPGNSYSGPDNGVCTALGYAAALKFLHTGTCPRGRVSNRRR